jgi:hypothetical protein
MKRRLVPLLLGVALLAALGGHFIGEALDPDITAYAVIGRELVHGRSLYSDLWDQKPPLVHGLYAAAYATVGEGPREIYLLWLLGASTTLIALFLAADRLAGFAAAVWTGAFLVPLSVATSLQANQPNTELFQNACLALGVMALVRRGTRAPASRFPGAAVWGAGAAFAAATMFKQTAAIPAAGIILGLLAVRRLRGEPWRTLLTDTFAIVAVVGAVWAAVCSYFAVIGHWRPFWDAVFVYNRTYAGDLVSNLARGLAPARLLPPSAAPLLAVLPAAALCVLGLVRNPRADGSWLVLAWSAAVPVCIALPGRNYAHYYQLWIPVLALGAGLLAGGSGIPVGSRTAVRGRALRWAIAAATLVALLLQVGPALRLSLDEVARRQYGEEAVEVRNLAAGVAAIAPGTDAVFTWGPTAGFYYYAHLRPPVGLLYYYPAIGDGPLARTLTRRVLRRLRARPPALVIAKRHLLEDPEHISPISVWLVEYYRHTDQLRASKRYLVLARRTSPRHECSPGDRRAVGAIESQ